jgi:hypothetical protein
VLELGPRALQTKADSLNIIWAIAMLKDGSVAVAGERGRIDRFTEGGKIRPWVQLPVGQVLSLAVDGDGVVAGTGPEGLVYRISAKGDTSIVAHTEERYVWGLAPAGKSAWYAATGTRGKLMKLERGRARVLLDSDESNLVSIASDGKGGVFAGGDSRGQIVHVRADGSIRTVYDAAEDEIRALTLGADGALYAAGLSASAVSGDEASEEGSEKPPAPAAPTSGAKAVVYRIVPDSAAAEYWISPQPLIFALAPSPEGVLAATGNRAGIYRLERPYGATLVMAAPQGQITALAVDASGRALAAGSNPGALWRLGPGRASSGELLSAPLDARRIARFGRIRWRGEGGGGRIELGTRSGNTETPDTTWSDWSGGNAAADGFKVTSPPARYLQWKLTLAGGSPRVESVETAWRENNLAPRIDELVVAPQGRGFREGDIHPRSEPVTQTLPGGQKVEYSLNPPAAPSALQALPMWARGIRTAQWKATDPNGDPLRYTIEVRHEGRDSWMKVAEDLAATTYTWDTNALPDGRYRLRVTASDQAGNAIGEQRTAAALSEPFGIDNTPPVVEGLDARGEKGAIQVTARARDASSALSGFELSLDDGNWRAVTPEGGLADDPELSLRTRLGDVKPGAHTVSVRVADLAGNWATRAVQVTVPNR